MKNRFLAIAAASTAALGSAIISAPAHAQFVNTPPNTVNVNLEVPEVLYLKTVSDINLSVAPPELVNGSYTQFGSKYFGSSTGGVINADGSGGVDTTSPFSGTVATGTVSKSVNNVYAVWSNSPRAGGVKITISSANGDLSGPNGSFANLTNVTGSVASTPALGLGTPITTNVTGVPVGFTIQLGGKQSAGQYTGAKINVQAEAP